MNVSVVVGDVNQRRKKKRKTGSVKLLSPAEMVVPSVSPEEEVEEEDEEEEEEEEEVVPLKRRSTRRLLVEPKRLKESRVKEILQEKTDIKDGYQVLPKDRLNSTEGGIIHKKKEALEEDEEEPEEDDDDDELEEEEEEDELDEDPPAEDEEEEEEDEEEEEESEEEEEETPVSARLTLRAAVQELLNSRVVGDSFLQDGPCFQSAPDIPLCHMCKSIPIPHRKNHLLKGRFVEEETNDINCCFYAFRKLRVPRASAIAVNGFLDPFKDPKPEDMTLWTPVPTPGDVTKALFILSYIGDQFCELVNNERKCLSHLKNSENKDIVWKPAVKGVREMCDVCQTTLFNYHWICGKCGIFVCPDCFQFRKEGLVSEQVFSNSSNDDYDWPLCGRGDDHRIEKLMLAQIIPRNELVSLADKVHALRHSLGLRQTCHGPKEFEEAFKLENSTDALSPSKTAKSVVQSNRSTYNCRLCPDGAFKWPSILYKHCVFKHFHSDIWKDLPDGAPYVCPQCTYCGRSKTMLALHYGITHKVVVKLYNEAVKSNPSKLQGESQGGSSVVMLKKESGKESPKEPRSGPQVCPLCQLKVSEAYIDSHLTVHLRDELLREVPGDRPWKCYRCHHIALSREALLRHLGIRHRRTHEILEYRGYHPISCSSATVKTEEESPAPTAIGKYGFVQDEQQSFIVCLFCESVNKFTSNSDFYRHLSEIHFKNELMELALTKEVLASKPFKCRQEGCEYASHMKNLIIHLGVSHRFSLKLYFHALGEEGTNWETTDVLPSKSGASLKKACPVCSEKYPLIALGIHVARSHFEGRLGHLLSMSPPFQCPLCSHISDSASSLLNHYGFYHKMFEKMSGEDVPPPPSSTTASKHSSLLEQALVTPPPSDEVASSSPKGVQCLLCDDVPIVGSEKTELYKHCSETHFKDKLSKMLILVSKGAPKIYKCPDCELQNQSQATVATHLGLDHQFARYFYDEVTGVSKVKTEPPIKREFHPPLPQQQQQQQQHHQSMRPSNNNNNIQEQTCNNSNSLSESISNNPHQEKQSLLPLNSQQQSSNHLNHPHSQQTTPNSSQLHHHSHSQQQQATQLGEGRSNNFGYHASAQTVSNAGHQHAQQHAYPNYHQGGNNYFSNYHHQQQQQHLHLQQQLQQQQQGNNMHHHSSYGMDTFHLGQQALDFHRPSTGGNFHNAAAFGGQLPYNQPVPYTNQLQPHLRPQGQNQLPPPTSSKSANNVGSGVSVCSSRSNSSLGNPSQPLDRSTLSPSPPPSSSTSEKGLMDCNLCTYKCKTMGDFMKHLVKVHFKQKLLDFMPKQKPFVCPWPNCTNEKRDRFNLAVHYGMTHKVVIQMLENMTNEPTPTEEYQRAQCKLCHQCFTSQRYMLTHLSTDHFQDRLDEDLPRASPWKCPKCFYVGSDIRALRIHFGTRHKVVVTFYAQSLGISINELEKELRDARKNQLRPAKKEGDISCNFCPRTFAQNEKDYLKHIILHLRRMLYRALPDREPYTCPKCSFVETGRVELLFHYGMVHTEVVSAYINQNPSQLDIEMTFVESNSSSSAAPSKSRNSKKSSAGNSSSKIESQSEKAHHTSGGQHSRVIPSSSEPPQQQQQVHRPAHHHNHQNHHLQHHHHQQQQYFTYQNHPQATAPSHNSMDRQVPRAPYPPQHQQYTQHHSQQSRAHFQPMVPPAQSSLELEQAQSYAPQQQQQPLPPPTPSMGQYQSAPQDLSAVKDSSSKLVPKLEPPRPASASEDKKFPKCRCCNYRYFNRLDLCRHFVDYHLRDKLSSLLIPEGVRCPRCPMEYKDYQSRLRHLIWSHEDLESLVMREMGVKLSEFPSTTRDLEISSNRERRPGGKELTDLAALPINSDIDVRCSLPKCELCGEEFTASSNKVRDKGTHLMSHFKDNISSLLPPSKPYRCPKCTYEAKDLFNLSRHLGLSHKIVFSLMQAELGKNWQLNSDDSCTCLICSQTFLNARTLNDHYCTTHYSERLGAGLPESEPFDCPKCKFSSKNYLTLVRHLGSKHDMVKMFLQEDGYLNKDFTPIQSFHKFHHISSLSSPAPPPENNGVSPNIICPLCQVAFSDSVLFLRHAVELHFCEQLSESLPREPPFTCPYCPFSSGSDFKPLVEHYGLAHKVVLRILNDKFGVPQSDDEAVLQRFSTRDEKYSNSNGGTSSNSSEECPICHNQFGGRYILLRHLAECHFRERLCNGLENNGVYQCPSCEYLSKDRQAFVRHYGLVHKMVQHFLREMGIKVLDEESSSGAPSRRGGATVSQPKYLELRDPYGHGSGMRAPNNAAAASTNAPAAYSSNPQQYYRYDQQRQQVSPLNYQTSSSSSSSAPQQEYLPPPPPPPPPPPQPSPSHQPSQSPYYDPYYGGQASTSSQESPLTPNPDFYGFNQTSPATPRPASRNNLQQQPQSQQPMTPGGSSQGNTPQPPLTPHDSGPPTPAGMGSPAYIQQQQQQQQQFDQFSSPRDQVVSPVANGGAYYPSPAANAQGYHPSGSNNYGATTPQNYSYDPEIMNKAPSHRYSSPGDELIKGPEPGMNGPFSVLCNYCSSLHKTKSDFYRHLAEKHFKNELMRELPANPPFLCTLCNFESKDRTLNPLIRHYGVAHKMVHKFVQGQFAGSMVPGERVPAQLEAAAVSSIKCPFCELAFATKYAFHQHLCDTHFKEQLSANLPTVPPFKCPVNACTFISKDSRHYLTRHYGMTHRFVVDILKNHIPEYLETDSSYGSPPAPGENNYSSIGRDYSSYQSQQAASTQQVYQQQQRQVELQPRQMGIPPQQIKTQLPMDLHNNPQHIPPHQRSAGVQHQMLPQMSGSQQVLIQPTARDATGGANGAGGSLPQLPSISEFFQNNPSGVNNADFPQPPSAHRQGVPFDNNAAAQGMHLEPQIDGTFDHPTNLILEKEELPLPEEPPTSSPLKSKSPGGSGPKTCELCFKTFEGKNKSMLKIQHLVFHFKDRLYANLKETSPPFSCPEEGCSYTSKHKPDWARHYGSVHKYIEKYLREKLEENSPTPAKVPRNEVEEEQGSTRRGFVQCFMCEDAPWFKNEDLLDKHFKVSHGEFIREFNSPTDMTRLNSLESSTGEESMEESGSSSLALHASPVIQEPLPPPPPALKQALSKNCGRPCEICGYEPKTKNKSRERQDHLAMKHYRDRIAADLSKIKQFHCPLCSYVGRDKQTIHRHYTGKHKVVEKYLAEDLASRKVILFSEVNRSASLPQVDGAWDDILLPQLDGAEDVPMLAVKDEIEDEEEEDPDPEDIEEEIAEEDEEEEMAVPLDLERTNSAVAASSSSKRSPPTSTDKVCVLCAEPLKITRHYHYAYKHFRNRLSQTLPFVPPFACPLCEYEAKYRFNLWMHYLSKHNFGDAWMEKTLSGELEREKDSSSKSSSSRINIPRNSRCSRSKNTDFWCDLCQVGIKATNECHHFASVHFQDRLKNLLREEVPHNCPLCHYEAKSYTNLCIHFLAKHGFLESWIRDAFEEMTEKMSGAPLKPPPSQICIQLKEEDEIDGGLLDTSDTSLVEELSTDEENEKVVRKDKDESSLGQGIKYAFDQIRDSLSLPRSRRRKKPKRRQILSKLFLKDSAQYLLSEPIGKESLPPRNMTSVASKLRHPTVDHTWICNGNLLVLNDSTNPDNIKLFKEQWVRGQPVIVANVDDHLDKDLWAPMAFKRDFGSDSHDIVNTRSGKIIPNFSLGDFWDGFEHLSKRKVDEQGNPMLLKLKDWPTDRDICHSLPKRFADLMNHIPLPDYTLRSGRFNLAASMPEFFVRPDLGPKMYIAYGNALYEGTGTTNLHIDMSDACNVLVYVGLPKDGDEEEHYKMGLKQVDASGCDVLTRNRVRESQKPIGAIWHIYDPKDADKIRNMLNAVKLEKGLRLTHNSDPIHDQSMYLDQELRERLYREYGVVGYAFPQLAGDTVFIPAGAPHQVRNIHNCIKIAEDFVTPENLNWCFYITEEFRHLSETHTNHEDKLQIKNMLYHSVKDCVSVLEDYERQRAPIKEEVKDSHNPPPSCIDGSEHDLTRVVKVEDENESKKEPVSSLEDS